MSPILRGARAAGLVLVVSGCAHIQEMPPVEGRARSSVPPAPKPVTKPPAQATTAPSVAPAAAVVPPVARESRRKGDERPDSYVVQKGDTLFGIALDFGYDYKDVAAWNGLADPSLIRVGQRLRLTPPEATDQPLVKPMGSKGPVGVEALSGTAGAGAATGETAVEPLPAEAVPAQLRTMTEPKAVTLPYSEKAYAQLGGAVAKPAVANAAPESKAEPKADPKPIAAASPVPALKDAPEAKADPKRDAKDPVAARAGSDDESLGWIWPAKGDLVYRFGETGNLKGVGIGGKAGQPVLAAAPGKVVYSGGGLRGYGKLVIIKHNDMFLSVYAHNSKILVKEGDTVKRGQRIADMGDTDASRVALHFEIRRFGKPVDPVSQLPADPAS
jgi:lipoprotein NlpD